jgi:hypothetical protein
MIMTRALLQKICLPKVRRSNMPLVALSLLTASYLVAINVMRVSAQKSVGAYAFLRNGDLWVKDKEQLHRLTSLGTYLDFAVSSDGSYLALIRTLKKGGAKAELIVFEMRESNSPSPVEVSITTRVLETCGIRGTLDQRLSSLNDLLAHKSLTEPEYADFRCSADRRVVVGYKRESYKELTVRGHPEQTLSLDSSANLLDVSPSGGFAAFYTTNTGTSHLCVWEIGETPVCILDQNVSDRISVSDSGDMIFATNSGESCLFKDGEHYSMKPLPGYETGDTCPDVAHWHKGMNEPEILEHLARHPQWLTGRGASQLLSSGQQLHSAD